MMSFEDYHLHTESIDSACQYIELLAEDFYRNWKEHSNMDKPVISFTNHHYMYNLNKIESVSNLSGVEIVPGFGILTSDAIELNIYNPRSGAKYILKYLSHEKMLWIAFIASKLFEKGITFLPKKIMKETGKKLYELEIKDIAMDLCDPTHRNINCECIDNAYKNHLEELIKKYTIPKLSLNELNGELKGEEVYIPINNINETSMIKLKSCKSKLKSVSGIIVQKKLKAKELVMIEDLFPRNKYEYIVGSGKWV